MKALIRLSCIALLAGASAAGAQEPLWIGAFVNEQQSNEGVEAAIDTAVASMNFVKRPIARSRLKKTNTPYRRIAITRDANTVSVAFDDQTPISMPADGTRAPSGRPWGRGRA